MSEPTTGIPFNLLRNFCSTDDYRPSLKEVIHDGQFAFATDGLLLVRTTSTHPATEGADAEKLVLSIRGLFAANFPSDDSFLWTSEIPAGEPQTQPCETCGGTGKSQDCPSCDGTGDVQLDHMWQDAAKKWHNDDYECECQHCSGSGKVGGEGEQCDECDGKGATNKPTRVAFGPAFFDASQFVRLRSLPGAQIHPQIKGALMQPHPIRGDGWIGIISPMRPPEAA